MKLVNTLSLIVATAISTCTLAQTGTVIGEVQNQDATPLKETKITLRGSNSGTISNNSGSFILSNVTTGKQELIFRHNDFKSKSINIDVKEDDTIRVVVLLQSNLLELNEVSINSFRTNPFKDDSSFAVSRLPLKDLENPQVYNSISKELIDQQVVTEFNDALKNATGISRLWQSTGRGGDGAEYYSMRGFSVQPTMVNGLPSVNNGVIDPANIESIEVIKGPSGTLFGSPMISYGGLINVTTKKAYQGLGGEFSYTAGSYGLNRITLDVNTPLTSKAAMRLNAAYHEQNSFQDAGFNKRIYIAPSFTFKATDKLTFLINSEFLSAESANAPMLFLNRNTPLQYSEMDLFERNYKNSYTSDDLTIKNPNFNIQAQALYKINKNWTSQTAISRSHSKTNGYYQYLWDLGDGDSFYRYISKRNAASQTMDIQQNFIGDFKIGKMRNRLVVGLDFFQSNTLSSSPGWVGNGLVSISNQTDSGTLSQISVDTLLEGSAVTVSSARNQVSSAYFSDVINILPSLSAMVSLRADYFQNVIPVNAAGEDGQLAFSPKLGLVYQPIKDKLSVFGNYMNGFVNLAPQEVADADGSNVRMETLDPEQANQYEFGIKSKFWKDKISATVSYYNILVSNKVMTDPTNINGLIQGGEVLSQGVEFSLVANPVKGLNIVAGFSYNETEVIEDDPANGYLGLRPESSGPAQMINFWASYAIPGSKLKGLGVGFGGNVASEHYTMNREVIGTFALPAYEVFNAAIFYQQPNYSVTVKVDNLLNTKYYTGWSTITPMQLRSASLKFAYKF